MAASYDLAAAARLFGGTWELEHGTRAFLELAEREPKLSASGSVTEGAHLLSL
ncbi:MAG: hypothetical protein ABIW17_07910 [Marmoricola sp.]